MRRVFAFIGRKLSSVFYGLGVWNILLAVGVLAAAGGTVFSFCLLREQVRSLPEFKVNVGNISVADAPEWVDGLMIKNDLKRMLIPPQANILDASLIPDLITKYRETDEDTRKRLHWLREITYVRKKYPNTLELKLSLRKPVARVMQDGEPYLTDSLGVRLPSKYYRKVPGEPDLLCIKGVRGRVPDEGAKWSDTEALLAGISTVEDVAEHESRVNAGITTVDVSNFGGRIDMSQTHIVLWTYTQTRVLWGHARSHPGFDDLTPEEKLHNLNRELAGIRDLKEIDYIQVYSRKPSTMPRKRRVPR